MTIYKRGNVWWYEFVYEGQRYRASAKATNQAAAREEESRKRQELKHGSTPSKPTTKLLFSKAAEDWLSANAPHWSDNNRKLETYNINSLLPYFGKKLLRNITVDDIGAFQAARKKQGVSPRTINMAVGSLRAILRKNRIWANLQPDVKMLKVKNEIGRALTPDEQHRLLTACKKSRSRSLYPAFQLSLHTGLRNRELRMLKWRQVDLIEGTLMVGESKTEAGSGRIVPLSQTALGCIKEWRSLFPDAKPGHYVFPSEKYAAKNDPVTGLTTSEMVVYDTDPAKPMLSWKSGWTVARKAAGVNCRWHDARHSFISALAEGRASDATIMAMSGHVSRKLLERYSHTRNEAKREAISALDRGTFKTPYPQNPPL